MLNRSGESRHPCIVPDLSGKAFSFCPLSMMLAVDFSYMAFTMLKYAASNPTFLSVFKNIQSYFEEVNKGFVDMLPTHIHDKMIGPLFR